MPKMLYSPGYGAGWSTWNRDYADFLLFDKGLIELAERGANVEEVRKYISEKFDSPEIADEIYLGGWRDIVVEYVESRPIHVTEYDGSESWEYVSELSSVFVPPDD